MRRPAKAETAAIRFSIPLKTVNEANGSHGHWAAKAGRRKRQRQATRLMLKAMNLDGNPPDHPPFVVWLTRVSAGMLDTDALPLSMKSIRDELADWLGVTDAPTDARVSWVYEQRKCKRGEFGVEVSIS